MRRSGLARGRSHSLLGQRSADPGHRVFYSQPLWGWRKAQANPGTGKTREVFWPLQQISGQLRFTDRLLLRGTRYFIEWGFNARTEGGN